MSHTTVSVITNDFKVQNPKLEKKITLTTQHMS